jgi:hypothetical protein
MLLFLSNFLVGFINFYKCVNNPNYSAALFKQQFICGFITKTIV